MERKERKLNDLLLVVMPFGLFAIVWALFGVRQVSFGPLFVALAAATVFLSSLLKMRLPRSNVHLTISDALLIISLILYGGEAAVLLAAAEAAFTSFVMKRSGESISVRTAALNIFSAAIVMSAASWTVRLFFGPGNILETARNTGDLITLLLTISAAMFLASIVCVSPLLAIKTGRPLLMVWTEYCPDALVMYLVGALIAGLALTSYFQANTYLMLGAVAFFAMVYWVYRRNLDDVRRSNEQAERAERKRAAQAEKHISELTHYVSELEKSSEELRISRERFRHAAYHDALTGLPNRNQLIDAIRSHIEKKRRSQKHQFAVLFLDLDRFKTINDSLGHSTGDGLIRAVSERLGAMLAGGQMLGRFSGDEFAILTGITDEAEAVELARDIAARLAQPFLLNERQVFTSVSIGIAFGSPNYTEADEMLRDADIAMYYAKESLEPYAVFDRNMHAEAVSLLQLETDLRSAIERKEIELYYQPIVDLGETKLVGFEALVRWVHPKFGVIPPSNFIPVSEATGLIVPLTLEILRSACRQMADWRTRFRDDAPTFVSVNLSGKHFGHADLVSQIKEILDDTGLEARFLKLEITESAVMENAERAIEMLQQIKEIGVRLCIDDFGTGHSSLSYLHRFPVDTLKVDRSFVSTMEDGSENGEIVRTVIALAKILKLNVVAEGIETIHQFHQLRVLGCEYGQGYLFSEPLAVGDIEKELSGKFKWEYSLPMPAFGSIEQNKEFSRLRIE